MSETGSAANSVTSLAAEPSTLESAEVKKIVGNGHFTSGSYMQAVICYTESLALAPSPGVLCNRAQANLKLENYGSAMADAEEALKLDPRFTKAYYRRGSALIALARYKEARSDFVKVTKLEPSAKDAADKLKECDKMIRQKLFEEAIETEASKPPSELLLPDVLSVDTTAYSGPILPSLPSTGGASGAKGGASSSNSSSSSSSSSGGGGPESNASPTAATAATLDDESAVNSNGISLEFVKAMIEEFRAQRLLHKKFVQQLLIRFIRILKTTPSLHHVPFPAAAEVFNVCGDTHGQYYDTLNIFDKAGFPSPSNPYLFNGDFVDRGSFSCENVITLFALKLLYPDAMHLTRGNHETKNMNKMYGFEGEVKAKYDAATMDLFSEAFSSLPLAVVIDRKVLVVHGGLFQKDGVKLDDIKKTPRQREPPESGIMSDILWSDPQPFMGRGPSKRGVGQSFGPDITARFLEDNGLELLIRSHEVMDEGYQVMHGGKLITVFSAPNYCDSMGNKGAVVRLNKECKPDFLQFSAVPHPPKPPMAYAGAASSMYGL